MKIKLTVQVDTFDVTKGKNGFIDVVIYEMELKDEIPLGVHQMIEFERDWADKHLKFIWEIPDET